MRVRAVGATGWFGRPKGEGQRACSTRLTHYVENGKPVCGYKPHPTMLFQFCAAGIHEDYIDCVKCGEWLKKKNE